MPSLTGKAQGEECNAHPRPQGNGSRGILLSLTARYRLVRHLFKQTCRCMFSKSLTEVRRIGLDLATPIGGDTHRSLDTGRVLGVLDKETRATTILPNLPNGDPASAFQGCVC